MKIQASTYVNKKKEQHVRVMMDVDQAKEWTQDKVVDPLKEQVRRIGLGDRSVEVEENATFHTHYRHATRTR